MGKSNHSDKRFYIVPKNEHPRADAMSSLIVSNDLKNRVDTKMPGTSFGKSPEERIIRTDSFGLSSTVSSTSTEHSNSSLSSSDYNFQKSEQTTHCRSSVSEIRSRFLQRLGISKKTARLTSRQNDASLVVLRGKDQTFQEDLKEDHGRKPRKKNNAKISQRNTSVSFDNHVTVHPIPKYSEYSDRIRPQLWSDSSALQANAARNCIEFASEGWNWQQVEEKMVVMENGEKIHPIHFMNPSNLNWRFCAARSVQLHRQLQQQSDC